MFQNRVGKKSVPALNCFKSAITGAAILTAGAMLQGGQQAHAADIFTWTNTATSTATVPVGTGNDFTNAANWTDTTNPGNTGTVPGGYAYFDNAPGSSVVSLIQNGDTLNSSDVVMGSQASTYGILVMTGGSLNLQQGGTNYWIRMGLQNASSADTSVFQMSGGTVSGIGQFRVGEQGSAAVNFSGGSITTTSDMYLGNAETSNSSLTTTGTLNMTGGNLTLGGWLNIGRQLNTQQSVGIMNLSAGTVNVGVSNGGAHLDFGGTTNILNMTGGTLNATGNDTLFSEQRATDVTSVWSMSGGVANLAGLELTQYNGTGNSPNYSATLNLNGGTISSSHIYSGGNTAAPGTSILNLNGGTLQLDGNANSFATFLGGLTVANVLARGAIIDTNGNNGTITQSLVSGVANGTDGGLTKLGLGLLTLANSNTYTGLTKVSAGALDLYYTNSILGGATPTNVRIANGAGLVLGIGGSNQFSTSDFTGITSHATFSGPTASIGIDTGAGSLTYGGNITDASVPGVNKLGFIKAGGNTLTLSGSNTYSGPTLLTGNGTTLLGSSQSLGNNSAVTLTTGAILDLNGFNLTIGSLASSGPLVAGETDGVNLTNGSVLTVGTDNTGTTYSYRIRGSGSLIKVGTGTLTLNYYDDQFTGGTTVNGGTLNLDGPGGYFGTVANVLTINSGGTVLASTNDAIGYGGTGPGVGTLIINGGTFVLASGNEGFDTNVQMTGGAMTATQGGSFNFAPGIGLSTNASNATANVSAGIQLRGGNNLQISVAKGTTPSSVDLAISGPIFESEGSGAVTFSGNGTTLLSGSNSYTGGTIVNGGKVIIASANALPVNSNLTINASSGPASVQFASHNNAASAGVLQLNSLSLSGLAGAWAGALDLTNNALIDHNDSLAQVTSQVAQGYNGGAWNGSGIFSSTAASSSRHTTALGVIQNNQSGSPVFSGSVTLDGVAPAASDILVKYTYYGDTDLSGVVDGSDYSRIDYAYLNNKVGASAPLTGWFNGDFNYDGVIDGSDYTLIDNAFNSQGASLASQLATPTALFAVSGTTSAVPEPASLGLLALGVTGLLRRRRRLSQSFREILPFGHDGIVS